MYCHSFKKLPFAIFLALSTCNAIHAQQSAVAIADTKNKPSTKIIKPTTTTLTGITVKEDTYNAKGTVDEQRLDAGVSTVMSKAEISRVPATGVADVVANIPGVSAYSDMQLGQAATGENQYISIRGLDASYNAYSLNGTPMPETDFSTRAVSLNMLSPFGIQSFDVSKTPTSDMPGNAIGGAIDIRTPTAFDFDKDLYLKTTVQGDLHDLARKRDQSFGGGLFEQEMAYKFGSQKNMGVYASVYYGRSNSVAEADAPNTDWSPVNSAFADATNLRNVGDLKTTQWEYDFYNEKIKKYGANISFDWHGDNTSLFAKAIYGVYKTDGTDNQVSYRTYPEDDDSLRGGYFNTRDIQEKIATLQLGGKTKIDKWDIDYGTSFGVGYRNRPNYVEASMYGAYEPGTFTIDTSRNSVYPTLVGSSSVIKYLESLTSDSFWKVQGHDAGSKDTRINLHANAKYNFDSEFFKSIKFGISADTSSRSQYDHPFFHDDNNFIYDGIYFGGENWPSTNPAGPTIAALPGSAVTNAFSGHIGTIKLINRNWVLSQAVPYKYVDDPGGAGNYTENDWNENTSSGRENIYAPYVMTTMKFNDLEAITGIRYELTNYNAASWISNGDDATGYFSNAGRTYGELLPSLNLNFRTDDLTVYRASLRRSFSRPAYSQLSGETTYTIDEATDQITAISEPNPNLKPTTATNFDLSAEFYDPDGGLITASAYYKWIHKFIYTSESATSNNATSSGSDSSTTVNGVTITMPENGGNAKLYGAEFDIKKHFTGLPGILSNFGMSANLTLQHSEASSGRADHYGRQTQLPRSPDRIYNLQMLYDDSRLHAALTYNYVGRQLFALTSNNLDLYLQPTTMLNLSASYDLPRGLSVSISARNLLNHAVFWETEGKTKQYLAYDSGGDGSYVMTGRLYMATLSWTF